MNQKESDDIQQLQRELASVVKPGTAFLVLDGEQGRGKLPIADQLSVSIISAKDSGFISVTKGNLVTDQVRQEAKFERSWTQPLSKPAKPDHQKTIRVSSTPGARLFSPRAGKLRIQHVDNTIQIIVSKFRLDELRDDIVAIFRPNDIQSLVFEKARYTGFDMSYGSVKAGDCLLQFSEKHKEPVQFSLADRGPTGLPIMVRSNHGPIWDLHPDRIMMVYRELIECARAAYADDSGYGRVLNAFVEMDLTRNSPGDWLNYDLFGGDYATVEREMDGRAVPLLDTGKDYTDIVLIPDDLLNERGKLLGNWILDLRETTEVMSRFLVTKPIPYGSSGKMDFGRIKARLPINQREVNSTMAPV